MELKRFFAITQGKIIAYFVSINLTIVLALVIILIARLRFCIVGSPCPYFSPEIFYDLLLPFIIFSVFVSYFFINIIFYLVDRAELLRFPTITIILVLIILLFLILAIFYILIINRIVTPTLGT